MPKVKCPNCGFHISDKLEVCPYCKASLVFSEDRIKKDVDAQVKALKEAVNSDEQKRAYMALGVLNYLHAPNYNYYEALVSCKNGEYLNAIELLAGNEDEKSLWLLLECAACSGDIQLYNKVFKSLLRFNPSPWRLYYHALVITENTMATDDYGDVNEGPFYPPVPWEGASKGRAEYISDKYKSLVNEFIARKVCDAFQLLSERVEYSDAGQDIENDDRFLDQWHMYSMMFSYYLEFITKEPEDFLFLDLKQIDVYRNDYQSATKAVLHLLSKLLIRDYPKRFEKDGQHKFFEYLYALGDGTLFYRMMGSKDDSFVKDLLQFYRDSGAENYEVKRMLGQLYVSYLKSNDTNEAIEKMAEELSLKDGDDADSITIDRIRNGGLSANGKIALRIAEDMFQEAARIDYGWKDAGMLSLSYIRLIELELNERLIKPALNNCDKEVIEKLYDAQKEEGFFKSRWERIIGNIYKVKDGRSQGLELGSLEWLLGIISSNKKKNDELRSYMKKQIVPLMTEEGVRALECKEIGAMISSETRDKYRNPPAHTRYLPFATAMECRDVVLANLEKLNRWIKQ